MHHRGADDAALANDDNFGSFREFGHFALAPRGNRIEGCDVDVTSTNQGATERDATTPTFYEARKVAIDLVSVLHLT
jgi:hypothetical protein